MRFSTRPVWALATLLAITLPASAQETGMVSGQVVDAETGRPVTGVLVRVPGIEPTETDRGGFFAVVEVPAGEHMLEVSHLGYGEHSQSVVVTAGEELSLTIQLSVEAIELAPFVVEARSEIEERRISSGHGINEIRRDEIEDAVRAGVSLTELLQTSMPGTMASPSGGSRTCVMYRAIRSGGRTACREVSVVLDGVMVSSPSYIYQTMPLDDIQRLEMLSPGQAGLRYGMGAGQAVLLIETRTGQQAAKADASRFVTGLRWTDENQRYPWLRVMGSVFLTNALTVGASLLLADKCLWSPEVGSLGLRTRCNGFNTASIGLLSIGVPATTNGFVARRMGSTERTRGRMAPAALAAAMTLTGGYLLVVQGGDAAKAAGFVILGAGVPITVTLADRIFRVIRP